MIKIKDIRHLFVYDVILVTDVNTVFGDEVVQRYIDIETLYKFDECEVLEITNATHIYIKIK